jgi:N-dimethylarginine dimethylaminohydrolase
MVRAGRIVPGAVPSAKEHPLEQTLEHTAPLQARQPAGGSPRLDRWGIDSEYGTLRDVLLGSPEGFRWLGEENAQYSALVRDTLRRGFRFDRVLALRQHAEMVDAYRHAGVSVHLLSAPEELPYAVYARDSNFMTPFGAVVTQLANPRRRGEYANVLRFYLEHDIPIYDLVSAGNFEGGDFNMIEPGCVLIGYTGLRGEEVSARQVGGWMEAEGLEVQYAPIDEYYVHIDLMVCMLAEKLCAVCLDTTDPDIVEWLRGRRIEIVPVSFRETMALGCNVVALGDDRVLSTTAAPELNAKLRALGMAVYDPDISQFQLAGGGVHCMCQPLRRDPA